MSSGLLCGQMAGFLPLPPLSRVFVRPQGPKPASLQCIPLVRFFSPEAAQERDENHLRAFRELHAGVELVVGKPQKTLYVSALSLIRAPLTALEKIPRRPEWAGERHGLPAHRKLF